MYSRSLPCLFSPHLLTHLMLYENIFLSFWAALDVWSSSSLQIVFWIEHQWLFFFSNSTTTRVSICWKGLICKILSLQILRNAIWSGETIDFGQLLKRALVCNLIKYMYLFISWLLLVHFNLHLEMLEYQKRQNLSRVSKKIWFLYNGISRSSCSLSQWGLVC